MEIDRMMEKSTFIDLSKEINLIHKVFSDKWKIICSNSINKSNKFRGISFANHVWYLYFLLFIKQLMMQNIKNLKLFLMEATCNFATTNYNEELVGLLWEIN